jgi:hypothetical protein
MAKKIKHNVIDTFKYDLKDECLKMTFSVSVCLTLMIINVDGR